MPRVAKPKIYRKATVAQVLYEYDGPKVILLKTPGMSLIIAVAIFKPDLDEPFLGAEITRDQLSALADEEFGLQYLFLKPKFKTRFFIDLADLDNGNDVNLVPIAGKIDISEFLPGRTFFASDFTEEIELSPNGSERVGERILVDGNWEIADFGDLYGGYADLYSFNDGLLKFSAETTPTDDKRAIMHAFEKRWQGGGSYGSFYRSMRRTQAPDERLGLAGFEYHSPGYVDLEGRAELLSSVTKMLRAFAQNRKQLNKAYKALYGYLSANKLLSLSADKFNRQSPLAQSVAKRASEFSALLPGVSWGTLLSLSGRDQLVAAKVLLSLFRRLDRLNEFQLQGRVTFGALDDEEPEAS